MGSPYYTKPRGNDDSLSFHNEKHSKEYCMSQGDVVLTVFFGKGVEVYYAPTGETHCWAWSRKELAWAWARERKAHINYVKGGGDLNLDDSKVYYRKFTPTYYL